MFQKKKKKNLSHVEFLNLLNSNLKYYNIPEKPIF